MKSIYDLTQLAHALTKPDNKILLTRRKHL